MSVSENNTEEVLASLDAIFKEYDAIFTSFVSLSSNNIIKSKNKILKHVKTIITDTLSDIILLKKSAGKDNAQYVRMINDIYERVYDGVMLVYNHEFNKLNNIKIRKTYGIIFLFTILKNTRTVRKIFYLKSSSSYSSS